MEEEYEAQLIIRLRPEGDSREQAARLKRIVQTIGTFMVDLNDWRFDDLSQEDRDDIIEIFANVF